MAAALETQNVFSPVVSKAVEESATAFFSGSCGLTHVPEADAGPDDPSAGIMSTISFMGDPPWAFALAFPEGAAVTIAKSFAGFDIPFDSPDMGDVVGEIVNVIAGDILARLAKKKIDAKMSLPTTVRGDNVAILVPSGASETRLTFSGPNGTCWFNLVGTVTDGSTRSPHQEPVSNRRPDPPAPAPVAPPPPKAAPVASNAPPPPSDEVMAAWAAAEAEAERELAEQDAAREAAEAAQRASGLPPPVQPVAQVVQPVARSHRLLYLAIVFACGGWGAAGSLAFVNARRHAVATTPTDEPAHDNKKPAVPPNAPAWAHIDALIRAGRFADALQQCLAAPKSEFGLTPSALAFREGLCLEGLGRWAEAADAYRRAESEPSVASWAQSLFGQARCAIRTDSYMVARALTNRVLLRSGHPDCRGPKVRDEALFLRARLAVLESGSASAGDPAGPFPHSNASNHLDGFSANVVPAGPVPNSMRDLLEVHRTLDAPGTLQVTSRLAPRPTIAVLRAIAATAGWKVQAGDAVVARLATLIGPLDVDHVPLPELLCALTEDARVAWVLQADTLVLTPSIVQPKQR